MKRLAAIGALLVPGLAWAAGGHHAVDDATILGPGECEAETWATHVPPSGHLLHAGVQCGVRGVEIGVAAEPSRQGGTRSDAWQAQLKWAGEWRPGVLAGLSITPQWDTRAHPRYQGTTVATLLTLQPGDRWQLHANVARDWLREGGQARAGVAADWTPDARWQLALERYLENRTGLMRAAVRWRPSGEWTLDMSRAQRLHGPRPSSWTLALTRSFARD